jgi:hypothetical protein
MSLDAQARNEIKRDAAIEDKPRIVPLSGTTAIISFRKGEVFSRVGR